MGPAPLTPDMVKALPETIRQISQVRLQCLASVAATVMWRFRCHRCQTWSNATCALVADSVCPGGERRYCSHCVLCRRMFFIVLCLFLFLCFPSLPLALFVVCCMQSIDLTAFVVDWCVLSFSFRSVVVI